MAMQVIRKIELIHACQNFPANVITMLWSHLELCCKVKYQTTCGCIYSAARFISSLTSRLVKKCFYFRDVPDWRTSRWWWETWLRPPTAHSPMMMTSHPKSQAWVPTPPPPLVSAFFPATAAKRCSGGILGILGLRTWDLQLQIVSYHIWCDAVIYCLPATPPSSGGWRNLWKPFCRPLIISQSLWVVECWCAGLFLFVLFLFCPELKKQMSPVIPVITINNIEAGLD